MLAPHLPPPTCNIEQHHRMQRLKVLAVATIFGLCAGLSGASMLVGWIWPTLGEGDTWIVSRSRAASSRQQVQDRVAALAQDTLFTIYSRTNSLVDKNVLVLGTPVGNGVGILSQGWLAAQVPAQSRAADLVAVGSNGLSYAITDLVNDKTTGVTYMHISRLVDGKPSTLQEQIHTVALADRSATLDDVVVSSGGIWSASTITDAIVPLSSDPHYLGATAFGLRLADTVPSGAAVFDANGRFIGFMNKNLVTSLAGSSAQLSAIIAGQTPVHAGLGVQGWFSEERSLIVSGQRTSGFLVNKVDARATVFKKGDILLTVNGEPFTIDRWQQLGTPASVRLTIFRAGQTVELSAPVFSE